MQSFLPVEDGVSKELRVMQTDEVACKDHLISLGKLNNGGCKLLCL